MEEKKKKNKKEKKKEKKQKKKKEQEKEKEKILSSLNDNNLDHSSAILETNSEINTPHNPDITQTNLISHDDIIINDTFFLLGNNNTGIYNKIIENLIQNYGGNLGQKIYIKGDNGFIFQLTTEENEIEILKELNFNQLDLSIIDLSQ